jgi:hypothetical protein
MIREERKGGNPYASLQTEDGDETSIFVTRSATEEQHARSENPYSRHYYFADEARDAGAQHTPAQAPTTGAIGKMSKSSFQQQVRAIFRPYIPRPQ